MSYLQKELGNNRAWIGVPASYYRSPHVPLEFRMPGAGPTIFQRPVVEVVRKPKKPISRKAISKPVELIPCPTSNLVTPYIGQWEQTIPAVVSIAKTIFGDGDDQSKKAESMGRRSARARKALNLIYPISNLIDNNRWNQLGQEFQRMMQIGNGGRLNLIANLLIRGTPYTFAKQAHDVILATSPASIIEKRGGQPAWTGLQTAVRTAFSQRKPEAPTIPPSTFIRQPIPTIRPLAPTAPYTTPYLPGYTPSQIAPYTTPYLPDYTPSRIAPPYSEPRIVTLPAPAIFNEFGEPTAPLQAGIDPSLLIWGGLGFLVLMMMRR